MSNSFNITIFQDLLDRIQERTLALCEKYTVLRHFFCRPKPLVYGDREFPSDMLRAKDAVLVIPPTDYWALRADLQVKSEKEAAKYGPALFDLDDGYRFEAQKTGDNSYILIAYNRAELSQKLHLAPILPMVKKITFAQWVFSGEPRPIRLERGKYLTVVDGIVIEMDAEYVHGDAAINLSEALEHPRSFYKTLPSDVLLDSWVTPKTLKTTLVILLIFFGNLVTNGVVAYQESNRLSENIQTVLDESKLPETSIEREAILDSLRRKESRQLLLRHQCKQISDIPMEVKPVSPPVIPSAPTSSPDGVVLIPGSKPGEPNRVLVGGVSNGAGSAPYGDGIKELTYDGNNLRLLIDTRESTTMENIKNDFLKRFAKARFEERDHQLEVRLK